jgi:hypothetical protein
VYEGTVMAIAMGGAFISFLVDYAGVKYLRRYHEHHGGQLSDDVERGPAPKSAVRRYQGGKKVVIVDHIEEIRAEGEQIRPLETNKLLALRRNGVDEEKLSVFIMEGGIIFHSIYESGMSGFQGHMC